MGNKKLYAGLDLGGTSMLAVVMNKNKVVGKWECATQVEKGNPEPIIAQIVDSIERACDKAGVKPKDLTSLGVGAAGAVDSSTGMVIKAPNLGWTDVPLAKRLRKALGVETWLDNDVKVAVYGEAKLGAARGASNVIGVWVGTGVGGGILIDGELYYGARGVASEFGHMVTIPDGPQCPCGNKGCIEAQTSRTSLEREIRAAMAAGRESAVTRIMAEKNKERMTSSVLAMALEQGDEVVTEVFTLAQRRLGLFIANLINALDPDTVVIGGGIAERMGEAYVGPIRKLAHETMLVKSGADKVRIVASELGAKCGAIGAALLGRHKLD